MDFEPIDDAPSQNKRQRTAAYSGSIRTSGRETSEEAGSLYSDRRYYGPWASINRPPRESTRLYMREMGAYRGNFHCLGTFSMLYLFTPASTVFFFFSLSFLSFTDMGNG
ncbi:hypothetical protein L873DRAFT_1329877 [Choiromyces venosus 120613-1]|uniref:Uncharacterized protein n=1 Tax=Choiromyces venosus 120613-1 TaxID=1336337 RepID=A0A3N4JDZ6_9PEZI|nr:hypothetical protein L873DRAFT_1329877 [Choiromyces venosus 120613-1]